jgi:hypothetical protein
MSMRWLALGPRLVSSKAFKVNPVKIVRSPIPRKYELQGATTFLRPHRNPETPEYIRVAVHYFSSSPHDIRRTYRRLIQRNRHDVFCVLKVNRRESRMLAFRLILKRILIQSALGFSPDRALGGGPWHGKSIPDTARSVKDRMAAYPRKGTAR